MRYPIKTYQMKANQYVTTTPTKIIFQSYNSVICVVLKPQGIHNGSITIGRDWDYSRTTMKYFKQFLDDYGFYKMSGAENVRKAICNGSFDNYTVKYDEHLK